MIKRIQILLIFILVFLHVTHSEITVKSATFITLHQKSSSYQWFFNGSKIEGAHSQDLKVKVSGNYTVKYMDVNGIVSSETVSIAIVNGTIHRIIVIGDSTASIYALSLYPRTGWAQVFQKFFNSDSILVLDKALSGRSSKSFYTDASGWPSVKPLIQAGDFLFIQFAHNDEKNTDTARYTEPFTTFKTYLKKYIDEARAKGAYPVLLTPIHRNNWNSDTITIKNSHGDYPLAMRQLASETNTPLIDISLKSQLLFEDFGKYATTWSLFLNGNAGVFPNYPTGVSDNTHLQEKGALEIAKLVADGIWESSSDTIRQLLVPSLLSGTTMNKINYSVFPIGKAYIVGPTSLPAGVNSIIKAFPRNGFNFVNWTENSNILSTNFSLSLSGNVSRNIIANFIEESTAAGQIFIKKEIIKIYPIPAIDQFTIESASEISEVCIYNSLGGLVFRKTCKCNKISLTCDFLNSGMYMVKLKTVNGFCTKLVEVL